MKPTLSIITLFSSGESRIPFLASLPEQSLANLEVLLADTLPPLPASLEQRLADKGIALRLVPANDACCEHAFWMAAVASARADWILHIADGARLIPGTALEENLDMARAARVDMLHFSVPGCYSPRTASLNGQEILRFFLCSNSIDSCELTNKVYSRGLCLDACGVLKTMPEYSGNNLGGLHLVLSSLAKTYSGYGKGIAEYPAQSRGAAEHAEHAAALYAAFSSLPDLFASRGLQEEIITLARKRLRTELSFALGRMCRRQSASETSGEEFLAMLHNTCGKEKTLQALLLAVACNAERMTAVYRAIYEDSLFNPSLAYGLPDTASTSWRQEPMQEAQP